MHVTRSYQLHCHGQCQRHHKGRTTSCHSRLLSLSRAVSAAANAQRKLQTGIHTDSRRPEARPAQGWQRLAEAGRQAGEAKCRWLRAEAVGVHCGGGYTCDPALWQRRSMRTARYNTSAGSLHSRQAAWPANKGAEPAQTPAMPPPAKEKEHVDEVWRTIGMLREDCSVCCRLNTCQDIGLHHAGSTGGGGGGSPRVVCAEMHRRLPG